MPRTALIVAHGQPSDPDPPEAEIAALARQVADRLSGWTIRSATLASPGALESAVRGLPAPLVFPFFMADGWFIRAALPERLARAAAAGARLLAPFGLQDETRHLAARLASDAAGTRGWTCGETTLILAAHGSGRSPFPKQAAEATAEAIARTQTFGAIRTGFIEEAPALAEAAAHSGLRAVCLPLFVARWGHMEKDVPEALQAARFSGVLLPPIGTMPEVPDLIARAIAAAGASA